MVLLAPQERLGEVFFRMPRYGGAAAVVTLQGGSSSSPNGVAPGISTIQRVVQASPDQSKSLQPTAPAIQLQPDMDRIGPVSCHAWRLVRTLGGQLEDAAG